MPDKKDKRLDEIVRLLVQYARLDFDERLEVSPKGDEIDAVIVGLNTLGEELENMESIKAEKVNEETARLAAIVDSSEDAIVSKSLDSIIRTWNRSAERMFGFTAKEAIGKNIAITIPEELVFEERSIISRIRRGERVEHYETIRKRKDGTRLEVALTVSPILDASGTVIGASNIARDISEKKLIERELKERAQYLEHRSNDLLNVLLRHTMLDFSVKAEVGENGDEMDAIAVGLNTLAEELESEISRRQEFEKELLKKTEELESSNKDLENFAYIASHDLQEPLRMVSSFLQLLEKKMGDQVDATGKEYIYYAVDGAKRMKVMINDLLAYSRITSRKPVFSMVDMNKIMEDVKTNLRERIRERQAIIETGDLPVLVADNVKITRLLQNLISNAIKFTGKGVTPHINVTCDGSRDEYTFSVTDN
ncbi:MAG TPA: PAS domain S-box protein, partial [Bacteroidia bacterium]